MESKTLNEWLKEFGYQWVQGREQLVKGTLTRSEARAIIADLWARGDIE